MARILIADDHSMIREALTSRLEALGHRVVGEAEDGKQAIALATKTACDLLMIDISMPGLDGFAASRKIRLKMPDLPILIVSTHDRQDYISTVKQLSVQGYLLKSASLQEMGAAIDALLSGGTYFPARKALVDAPGGEDLTQREAEILTHIRAGLLSKEIAARLDISIRTVEAHRRNLNRKLNE